MRRSRRKYYSSEYPANKGRSSKKRLVFQIVTIFFVVSVGTGITFAQYKKNHPIKVASTSSSQESTNSSLGFLSKTTAPSFARPTNTNSLNNFLSNIKTNGFDSSTVNLASPLNSNFYSQFNSGGSYCSLSCNIYDSSGSYIRVTCSSYINTCSAYNSNGGYANTYCSSYINSCNTYDSNGNSYNTNCSNYINSCSTTGSNGFSSNTYCSSYINNCNTYDSSGNTYNTYCSSYISSCSTYGSNGYSSNTYCSSYISSCSTYRGY
jgi:hypothetical protein